MDCSLPGSSAHGILQARRLEWVAIPVNIAKYVPKSIRIFGLKKWRQLALPGSSLYLSFYMRKILTS